MNDRNTTRLDDENATGRRFVKLRVHIRDGVSVPRDLTIGEYDTARISRDFPTQRTRFALGRHFDE
jgi:hypothetical protein